MKVKKENALVGIDMVITVVVVIIFSVIILTLITNNAMENVKTTKDTMAMIYITEIFEKIAIKPYDDVVYNNLNSDYTEITEENSLVSQEIIDKFKTEIAVITEFEELKNSEEICKKIKVKLTYEVADKKYERVMERLKIKE